MKIASKLAILAVGSIVSMSSNSALAAMSSSGQISQTGWRLVDLDLDDGITPELRYVDVYNNSMAMVADNLGNNFPNSSSSNNFEAINSSISHLNSGATSSFANNVLNSSATLNNAGWVSTAQSLNIWFTLTPHTRLEYFGVATGNAANAGSSAEDGSFKNIYTIISANLTPNGQQGGTGVGDDPFNHYFGSIGAGSQAGNNSINDHFQINYENPGATALGGKLEMKTYVFGSMSVTPVPEPETYAMMLGGLAVLGALSRRRKQQRN